MPDVSTLESTALAPLVASHQAFKPRGAKTAALAAPTSRKAKAKKPKPLDPDRPLPDPERWLPKRQRTGYVPPRTKLQVKKDKARQKLATQGSSGPSASTPASTGGGGKRKGRR